MADSGRWITLAQFSQVTGFEEVDPSRISYQTSTSTRDMDLVRLKYKLISVQDELELVLRDIQETQEAIETVLSKKGWTFHGEPK